MLLMLLMLLMFFPGCYDSILDCFPAAKHVAVLVVDVVVLVLL